jgi:hypothetical protein
MRVVVLNIESLRQAVVQSMMVSDLQVRDITFVGISVGFVKTFSCDCCVCCCYSWLHKFAGSRG